MALETIGELVNNTDDPIIKGFLMLEKAKYCNFVDQNDAQQILVSAQSYNEYILKPIIGIKSVKEMRKLKPQAQQILDLYSEKDVNDYIIEMNTIIESLIFAPSSYNSFENAFMKLGILLGWNASRPDKAQNGGPDVLWSIGDNKYLVIECKNEANSNSISKKDCEQLLSSVSWFKNNFSRESVCTPIMIHPSTEFDIKASPTSDFRIIDDKKLSKLKANLKKFCEEISTSGKFKDHIALSKELDVFGFTTKGFVYNYTTDFIH